ncbi:dihydrolipoyl dehydrogenase [Halorhodospira neutriphila]|uniref:Dihydrolipoyl dehydrogenase n=1 Tax=Halorhodospira neutriphila TaxID=168379 RepID=A0ABS1E9M2_9GAMM|nr:dihydrolipoyl dehydrogenase [Halorhodospira neutriphila]MBK1727672.1 dihydrolipoyl dehydrogenase [Halorhodospira neutriphila]
MSNAYDVIIIGAGPAGYSAAIRCAQLGMRTAVVDEFVYKDGEPALGGTCLNVGCIPSKALLDSSEQYHRVTGELAGHGITAQGVALDVPTMIERKDRVVKELTGGVRQLFKANKIDWLHGHGKLVGRDTVQVTGGDGAEERYSADAVILASGSRSVEIGAAPLDHERIVNSSGALEFTEVPPRLGIIGAGVIGLEMASVWSRLGSEVVLLEAQDELLAPVDRQIVRTAQKAFKGQGLDIRLGCRVTGTQVGGDGVTVAYEDPKGQQELAVDRLIVCVGRRPNTDDLFSDELDLLLDERGFINVDEQCRTNLPGVYAVGDVVRGPMLAHKGQEEGVMVAERLAGKAGAVSYETIPWVIYTEPEIAWVGRTEAQLKAAGVPYTTGTFNFAANGRARAMDRPTGLVKLIAHAETDRLLGAHIIGPQASELIAEAVVTMEFAGAAEDLARTIHAHPTLSEAVHEAALAVGKRAIHKAN